MDETVQRHLLPLERIVWSGRPSTGVMVRPIEALLIPFSLLWGGFALFWNVSVWSTDGPIFFKLWGLPFLVAGIYITVGRFWIDMRARRAMLYVVTDKRILILKKNGAASSKSLDIKRLPALELNEKADGTGTLKFGSGGMFNSGNFGIWSPAFDSTPQFLGIDDVRRVYEVVQKQAG